MPCGDSPGWSDLAAGSRLVLPLLAEGRRMTRKFQVPKFDIEFLVNKEHVGAPDDAIAIDEYIKGVGKMRGFDMFTMMLGGIGPKLSILRYLPSLNKWGKVTMQQYGERF